MELGYIKYESSQPRRIRRQNGDEVEVEVTGKLVRLETGRGNPIIGFTLRHDGQETTLEQLISEWGEDVELPDWPEFGDD